MPACGSAPRRGRRAAPASWHGRVSPRSPTRAPITAPFLYNDKSVGVLVQSRGHALFCCLFWYDTNGRYIYLQARPMSVSYVSRSLQSRVATTHSRSSSPYDWSTRSELYPEAETAKGQPGCTHTEIAHTLGNGDKTQQPARDYEGELAAAAAAPPLLLLQLLLLCCCCCCAATRDASRSTNRHNRLFLVLCFLQRTQKRVTAQ